MQDAKRIQEQTAERSDNARVRAAAAEDHRGIAEQRKTAAHVALSKFQLLGEMFGIGQRLLEQRREQFAQAEQPPPQSVLAGLAEAHAELGNLVGQTREHAMRHEGALQALQAMEDELRQAAQQAEGQGRGVEVAGQRAVDLAARSGEITTPEPAPESTDEDGDGDERDEGEDGEDEDDGVGDLLDVLGGAEVSAKEPIGTPQGGAPGKGRSRRKAE